MDNLERCSWPGLPPRVASPSIPAPLEKSKYKSWLTFNATRLNTSDADITRARFVLYGKNTRACKLQFGTPISAFTVKGQAPHDKRFPPVPEKGSTEIRLWSRTWDRAWTVDVDFKAPDNDGEDGHDSKDGVKGAVVCLWSDVNQKGTIPAFDEAMHYVPDWVAITKAGDGLVEGYKRFKI
jgi:hypothetical protein